MNREQLFQEMSPLGKVETSVLCNWLNELGFFEAPASTKYHLCYPGGLFEHSRNVYIELMKHIDKKKAFMIAFLHDICKCDAYIPNSKGGYDYNADTLLTGHGEKSVMMLYNCPLPVDEEMIACIRYHMGAFTTDKDQWRAYTNAIHRYPSVLWTHTADMVAAHIVEVQTEERSE